MHQAMQRAWLQTGGLPVLPIHGIMRDGFDQVDRVEYLGAGCAKLYDPAGRQIGILQFQGALQDQVDAAAVRELQAAAAGMGTARVADPAAGDTVIRPLDMNDPTDRELARLAGQGNGAIMSPTVADDLPPIDLPDWQPADDDRADWGPQAGLGCVAVAFVVVLVIGALLALAWRLLHA